MSGDTRLPTPKDAVVLEYERTIKIEDLLRLAGVTIPDGVTEIGNYQLHVGHSGPGSLMVRGKCILDPKDSHRSFYQQNAVTLIPVEAVRKQATLDHNRY